MNSKLCPKFKRKARRGVSTLVPLTNYVLTAILWTLCGLVLTTTLLGNLVYAQSFNPEINYQGKLLDSSGGAVADGNYHMYFRLYDQLVGGSPLWEGDRSGLAGNRVPVTNGLFSVMLGSSTPLASVDFNQTLYLEVEIGGTASSSFETLAPRKRIGSVPSAFEADNATTFAGLATTSFLRSDQNATFTATTLTIDTGSALSVLGSGSFTQATSGSLYATTLGLNSEYFTDLTGTGLTNNNGVLEVSSSSLALTLDGLSDVDTSGVSQGNLIYYNAGTWEEIATSSLAINTDHLVEGSNLFFTTGRVDAHLSGGTGITYTTGAISFDCSEVEGTGINCSGENITLDATGDWTGTIDGNNFAGGAVASGDLLYGSGAGAISELSIGTVGQVLTVTGGLPTWSATSSLGVGDGTFLGLTDTPDSYGAGSILFTSGSGVASNTSQFFWDNSNNRLGLGTTSPWAKLSVDYEDGTDTGPRFVVGSSSETNLVVDASGNVGVGISNPEERLEIADGEATMEIRSTDTNANAGLNLTGRNGGSDYTASIFAGWLGSLNYRPAQPSVGHYFRNYDNSSILMIIRQDTENVGIGTTSPWAKLSVDYEDGTDTGPRFVVGSSTETNLIVAANGNVGIGTNNPGSTMLSVNGNIAGTWLTLNSAGSDAWLNVNSNDGSPIIVARDNDLEVFRVGSGGRTSIGTSSPSSQLSVWADSTDTGAVVFNVVDSASTTLWAIDDFGTSTASNGINITSGCYAVNGTCLTTGGASTFLGLTDTPDAYGAGSILFTSGSGVASDTAQFFWDDTNNRLGIGTTSPWAKLSVDYVDGTDTGPRFVVGSSTDSNLIVDENGLVGIGTSNPGAQLDIYKGTALQNLSFEASRDALFTAGGGMRTSVSDFSLNIDSNDDVVINIDTDNSQADNFRIRANGNTNDLFTILNAGRAGFGTTSPWAKLSVDYEDGTDTGPRFVVGSSTESNLFVGADGRVGIGTINPVAELHVTNGDLEGSLFVGGTSGGTYDGHVALFGNDQYPQIAFRSGATKEAQIVSDVNTGTVWFDAPGDLIVRDTIDGGNTRLIVDASSGNIGIGSSSPWAKLTVTGTAGQTDPLFVLASSTENPFVTVTSEGWLGIGTSSPDTLVHITGTTSTTTIEGSLSVANGAIFHDFSGGETSISQLNLGNMRFDTDAGKVAWVDLPISSSAATNTVMAYTAAMDDLDVLTVWARATGEASSTAKDLRVVIGSVADSVLSSSNIPTGSFIVADGAVCVDDGGGTNCDDASRTAGNIYAESSTVTAIDLAENFPVQSSAVRPRAGQIVALSTQSAEVCTEIEDMGSYLECRQREVQAVPFVEVAGLSSEANTNTTTSTSTALATTTTQTRLLGVVSTEPGVLLGGFGKNELIEYEKAPVALAGRVPIQVTTENGAIEAGDRIALSSTVPGAGVRAIEAGETVGVALTSLSEEEEEGEVLVFIDLRFYVPSFDDLFAERTYEQDSSVGAWLAEWIDVVWQPLGRFVTASVGWFDTIISREIVAENALIDRLQTRELCVGEVCVSESQFMQVFGDIASTNTNNDSDNTNQGTGGGNNDSSNSGAGGGTSNNNTDSTGNDNTQNSDTTDTNATSTASTTTTDTSASSTDTGVTDTETGGEEEDSADTTDTTASSTDSTDENNEEAESTPDVEDLGTDSTEEDSNTSDSTPTEETTEVTTEETATDETTITNDETTSEAEDTGTQEDATPNAETTEPNPDPTI